MSTISSDFSAIHGCSSSAIDGAAPEPNLFNYHSRHRVFFREQQRACLHSVHRALDRLAPPPDPAAPPTSTTCSTKFPTQHRQAGSPTSFRCGSPPPPAQDPSASIDNIVAATVALLTYHQPLSPPPPIATASPPRGNPPLHRPLRQLLRCAIYKESNPLRSPPPATRPSSAFSSFRKEIHHPIHCRSPTAAVLSRRFFISCKASSNYKSSNSRCFRIVWVQVNSDPTRFTPIPASAEGLQVGLVQFSDSTRPACPQTRIRSGSMVHTQVNPSVFYPIRLCNCVSSTHKYFGMIFGCKVSRTH